MAEAAPAGAAPHALVDACMLVDLQQHTDEHGPPMLSAHCWWFNHTHTSFEHAAASGTLAGTKHCPHGLSRSGGVCALPGLHKLLRPKPTHWGWTKCICQLCSPVRKRCQCSLANINTWAQASLLS